MRFDNSAGVDTTVWKVKIGQQGDLALLRTGCHSSSSSSRAGWEETKEDCRQGPARIQTCHLSSQNYEISNIVYFDFTIKDFLVYDQQHRFFIRVWTPLFSSSPPDL